MVRSGLGPQLTARTARRGTALAVAAAQPGAALLLSCMYGPRPGPGATALPRRPCRRAPSPKSERLGPMHVCIVTFATVRTGQSSRSERSRPRIRAAGPVETHLHVVTTGANAALGCGRGLRVAERMCANVRCSSAPLPGCPNLHSKPAALLDPLRCWAWRQAHAIVCSWGAGGCVPRLLRREGLCQKGWQPG